MRQLQAEPQSREWKQARRTAFVQDVLASFTQRPSSLLSFEQVSQKLQLSNVRYLGLEEIFLDQIVGSVGRYSDFTRAFLPRQDHLQDRWQRIEQLVATGREMPPIELYQVGQAYFVRDGNHRVSVARQHGTSSLKAYVWQYETPVAFDPDSNIDDLLCRTAHAAFLERTRVDRLCPDAQIRFTQPGGYEDLLAEIEAFQQILSEIDRREVPFDEAVTLWCDIRYHPIVEIIRQRHVLDGFPGRTETDLYLWLCRNREELAASYRHGVLFEEAADDLARRFSEALFSARPIRQAVSGMVGRVHRAGDWWKATRQRYARKRTTQPPPQSRQQ
jgi:hypothetical protein